MEAVPKHIYLLGCGGVGMVWIADYALRMGWKVSGSDLQTNEAILRLQKAGANIHSGVDPDAIPADITEAVITSAITQGSPGYAELEELQRRGIPTVKRAAWIGKLSRQKFTIAVAGAHGKTTTTAMIGWILEQAALDPTVFVGGSVPAWEGTRIGQSQYLVLEADEFDRSFHQFYPQIAVLLNIDLDHTDYYTGGLPEIEHAYHRFLRNLPPKKGIVIGYGKDARIRKVSRGFSYHFRWYSEEQLWPGLKLAQPGMHNLLNASAAARVAHEIGVDQETIKKALATFPGVGRRLERVGEWNAVEFYDDYAHHPNEIKATLAALRERFPKEHITLVFQPHQKARTQALLKEFGRAFDRNAPDTLILAPIYQVAGREGEILITNHTLGEEVNKLLPAGMKMYDPENEADLEKVVRQESEQPGIMVTMGAGNIRQLVEGWR